MNLYIAEKPSLGRAIADALPRPHQRGDGYIKSSNGDCVSWCIGHLLEQAEPHLYDAKYKSWRLEHLPIVPDKWKLTPKPDTRKQLAVLRKLVAEASVLIHAGDPDREGQLLVDQVIDYLKVAKSKRKNIKRLLVNDMNPAAVTRALSRLESNADYVALSVSALARSRADWLYGINLTRAYTIQGRKVGYDGVLSVGRVQTPVLGLVVRRCEEIENFVSKPFYEVTAHLHTEQQEPFTAQWQPSEACLPYMDEAGRVLVRELAENVVTRISGKPALVQSVERKKKTQRQPLPYSLSALQIDAGRRFGISAQQTLTACQALYERHKLITYPRSDCRYLPNEHYAQAADVLASIAANAGSRAGESGAADVKAWVDHADVKIKSAAWDDKRVEAHHAIIPTQRKISGGSLSEHERKVYELVSRQYIAQFYPIHKYTDVRVEIVIEGGLFISTAKTVDVLGWKQLFQSSKKTEEEPAALPSLEKGQALTCERGELVEKQTTPPAYFTDATLLAAMTGIARYVSSAELRKVLKETDGLGTEATRAGIIELLFRRGFLQRQGKQIHDTPAGRGLVHTLPADVSEPDRTAHWEATLNAISQRQSGYDEFMQPLVDQLRSMIAGTSAVTPDALKGVEAPPRSGKGRKKTGKKGIRRKAGGGAAVESVTGKRSGKKRAAKKSTVKKSAAKKRAGKKSDQ